MPRPTNKPLDQGLGCFYPANRIWRYGTELGGGYGFRPYAANRRKLEFEARVEHIGFTGSHGQEEIWSGTAPVGAS